MNTREIATEYRLSHWAGIMRERQESGRSIKSFCQHIGCHENVYYYWQRKLREVACSEFALRPSETEQGMTPGRWVRLEPSQASPSELGVTIKVGGWRVTATCSTDPTLLAQVCRMLKSL
jgi:putative transposase